MSLLKKILSDRRFQRLAGVSVLCGAGCLLLAWKFGITPAMLKSGWEDVNHYLAGHSWLLFWALVFLPGLPIPTSALLFTAGVVWRENPLMAVGLCMLAMLLNLTWTYWLAAGPARRIVERILASSTRVRIPEVSKGDHLKLILVMRLTPGFPFFFQNYVLGFMRPPFLLYLPVSLLCSGVIGTGFVLSGAGLADGKLTPVLTGVSLIVLGGVITHSIRGWLARKKQVSTGSDDHASGDGLVGAGVDEDE